MVNNCLFLDNAAVFTGAGASAFGGAISVSGGKLTVVDSIFKKNKAIATASGFGGGGAIYAFSSGTDVLVPSSVLELNEASNVGGAAVFELHLFVSGTSVAWYNNKELLFGNDGGVGCDGANVVEEDCFSVGDNFSL